MSAALEETSVTYEDLAEIEREFDDVETEIIRQQVKLTRPLYAKRHKTVSQIPNFWPLVIEQAPPDIDEYIQPSDSALLLSSLTSLSVSHFELNDAAEGEPRSVAIRWEFSENEYFDNSVLEKKFWYRHSRDGWAGLVSEPVDIRWKKGKDLTGGLLGMVKRVWDEEKSSSNGEKTTKKKTNAKELTAEQKALQKMIEKTGLGGVSFFAWFGFRGRNISAEESRLATKLQHEKRKLRQDGQQAPSNGAENGEQDEDDEEEDDDDELADLEIFPEGDNLAVTISEDLWPGALKYFTQAQEQDALSDDDFESDEDGGIGEDDDLEPPAKRHKS